MCATNDASIVTKSSLRLPLRFVPLPAHSLSARYLHDKFAHCPCLRADALGQAFFCRGILINNEADF